MTTPAKQLISPGGPVTPNRGSLRRFATPGLADAIFLVVLLRVVQMGATDLFNDPGTGWHLRTGLEVLATGEVPAADAYSATCGSQPWVATQWLGDVILALGYVLGGYTLVAMGTAVLLAGLFRWLYRAQVSCGGWPVVAALVTLAAACAASIHFLARPLLATFVGVPLCFWWATSYARGQAGPVRVWLLAPLAVVWCNIHPGVLGGVATVVLCGSGLLTQAVLTRSAAHRRQRISRAFLLLFVGAVMGMTTLLNPYGVHWHAWISRLMGTSVLSRYVSEWKPLHWADAAALVGAALALLAIGTAVVRRRGFTIAEGLVVSFWVFQAAQSARHLPLMVLIVGLQLGRVLAGIRTDSPRLLALGRRIPLFSPGIRDAELRSAGGLVSTAGVAVLLALVGAGVTLPALGLGNAGPPEQRYSPGALAYLRHHGPQGRFFNDLNYGGTLIRDVPGLPVFVDDRFGLYGEEFIEHYCRAVLEPDRHAARLLDRWQIETVLVGSKLPLCGWLADQPDWTPRYQDGAAAIYARLPERQEHTP